MKNKPFLTFALGLLAGVLIIGAALAFVGMLQAALRPWLGLAMSLGLALAATLATAAIVWLNPPYPPEEG